MCRFIAEKKNLSHANVADAVCTHFFNTFHKSKRVFCKNCLQCANGTSLESHARKKFLHHSAQIT